MKKTLMLLAAAAFSSAAFAQGDKVVVKDAATGTKTETTVRDNGTVKTETRTGRTEVGQKAYNTKEDVKVAGQKTGNAVEKGAKKTGKAVKKGAKSAIQKAALHWPTKNSALPKSSLPPCQKPRKSGLSAR